MLVRFLYNRVVTLVENRLLELFLLLAQGGIYDWSLVLYLKDCPSACEP